MTALYRELKDINTGTLVGVFRTTDGASIPLAPGNRDYNDYLEWVAAGNVADPDPNFTVDAARARIWETIKTNRDNRKAGGVKVGTNWIHTDDSSRIQWLGIKDTARDLITAGGAMTDTIQMMGQPLSWKTLSGAFVTVTNQMAFDVVQATKNLDAVLFTQAETKRAAVNASSTPETVDITTGWNLTYAESV